MNPRPRIAIVSPFLDKQHGTERCVAEQVERLAGDYEIHVYSNRVQDVDLSRIRWHRVPVVPGPHLLAYCWWIVMNRLCRWWDARFRGLPPAIVYSPGVNCFDADVISVHVVFGEYRSRMRDALQLGSNPLDWPRRLHRRMYYRLLSGLEQMLYGGDTPFLTVVSAKVARDLKRYGRTQSQFPVIMHGTDAHRFNLQTRALLRESARQALGLRQGDFALLLVGNEWKNKGLPCLLESLGRLKESSIRLLVVGSDKLAPYRDAIARCHLEDQVIFLAARSDIEFYYAAADIYVGPSLEDAFALPPLEAMACGVPAIVSSQAGVSEVITDGVDGFVLDDPRDSARLADLIAQLYRNPDLRQRIAQAAGNTARQYSWDRNAQQLSQLFQEVLQRKTSEQAIAHIQETAR